MLVMPGIAPTVGGEGKAKSELFILYVLIQVEG